MASSHAALPWRSILPRSPSGGVRTGLIVIAVGVVSVLYPVFSTFGSVLVAGAFLAATGVVIVVHCVSGGFSFWRVVLQLVWGIAAFAAGMWVLATPAAGALALTSILVSLFLIGGTMRITLSLLKPRPRFWGLALGSGFISIALALIVIWALPYAIFWLPGTVIGVDLVFAGAALMALNQKALSEPPSASGEEPTP